MSNFGKKESLFASRIERVDRVRSITFFPKIRDRYFSITEKPEPDIDSGVH